MEHLLTIAVPTYNRKNQLEECLIHLLPQYSEEVEVIVSDNASTDETQEFMLQMIEKYPYIRYIRNEENIFADGNFMQCLEVANGKFVLILSDDDFILDGCVNNILELIKKYPDSSLMYLNSNSFKYIDGKCKYSKPRLDENLLICTNDKNEFFKYVGCEITFVSTLVFNKESYDKVENPAQYKNTSFFQSYVALACTEPKNSKIIISGFNAIMARAVDGVNFSICDIFVENLRVLLDYAISIGYDKAIVDKEYYNYIKKNVFASLIAAKISKNKKMLGNIGKLFKYTYKQPEMWVTVYPFIFMPRWLLNLERELYRRIKKKYE